MNIYPSGKLIQIVYISLLRYRVKAGGYTVNIEICQTDLFNRDLITLITQLDAYQESLYPAENNHAESIERMAQKKSDSRGLGIASMLATALIDKLIYLNLKNIYLEKEVHQPEAVKIYQRLGFELTSVFGCYQYDPLSLYRVKNWLVVLGER